MAHADEPRRAGGWLTTLIGGTLFLAGCSGGECVSGPLCGDDGGTPQPPVTGTISGTVTIGATGIAGVTVTLSNGSSAITGASGSYSFTGVAANSYTVSISNIPASAICATTSRSVTISSSARQATANFTCQPAPASISGTVSAARSGIANVQVDLSGPSSSTTTTSANGQYSFAALGTGTYTVTISGFDEVLYSFPTTSQVVTLSAGESATADFEGGTCRVGSISLNSTVNGSLATTDCALSDGEFTDAWTFTLGASTNVQIGLASNTFDTYLILTDPSGGSIAENDDAATGTNSLIVASLAAGDYIIWASSFAVGETGTYQLSLQETSGRADLVVDSVIAPPSAARGATIQLFTSVTNLGDGPAGSFRTGIYWSTNTTITRADRLSASCTFSALSAGGVATCSGDMTVPSDLAPGTYYIGVIADDQETVSESNEDNNTGRSSQIIIS